MNWGMRITILYLGFVSIILTLVVICFGHKTELEYKDYYSRELKFQEQIDATANASNLVTPVDYWVSGSKIQIKIPKELLDHTFGGEIVLMKPSDASKDQHLELHPDEEGVNLVNGSAFAKGVYKMQISFHSNNKKYFKENIITLK